MKKKELLKLMSGRPGIKIAVNPEQSRRIQELCFENDIEWNDSGKHYEYYEFLKFVMIDRNGRMFRCESNSIYNDSDRPEIFYNDFIKIMEKKEMKLNDLKTGDKVTLRNGNEFLVIKDSNCINCLIGIHGWHKLQNYHYNMKFSDEHHGEYDIMKVENTHTPHGIKLFIDKDTNPNHWQTIWQRSEKADEIKELKQELIETKQRHRKEMKDITRRIDKLEME